jgi:gamma-glutamyltranspeptidase / glutathione hydrolase
MGAPHPLPGNERRIAVASRSRPPGPNQAAVATAFPEATAAAAEILRSGGNAIDAAVAAAWALSVCEPSASGLGGQTVLMVRLTDGTVRVIDGHSHAPAAASLATIDKEAQRHGYRACAVPSTAATLDYAHRKYGVLARASILAPAIRLAEEGFALTSLQHRQTGWVSEQLRATAAGGLFLREGIAPAPGSVLRQPALAATLRRLAKAGIEDFYCGGIARQIAAGMRVNGGLITEQDLAELSLPVEREPVAINYRGYRVLSVPPPGGGVQLLLALKILEQLPATPGEASEDEWREGIAQAVYLAFRSRERHPLAPESFTAAIGRLLLSDTNARELIAERENEGPPASLALPSAEEAGDTTHLTVCDRQGNVAALTQSIQSLFGAKVADPALGFLYNNYLRTCPRRPHPQGLCARAVPRSNAAPTLALRDDHMPVLTAGAAGSRRIVSSVLQTVSGVLDRGLDVAAAVSAPRVHALIGGKVWIERPAASAPLLARLRRRFGAVIVKTALSYRMGAVQGLQFAADGSALSAADPRRDGLSVRLQPWD